jgi:hypothetical protein
MEAEQREGMNTGGREGERSMAAGRRISPRGVSVLT